MFADTLYVIKNLNYNCSYLGGAELCMEEILVYKKDYNTNMHKIQLLKRKNFERFCNFELTNCKTINPDGYFPYDYTPEEFTFRFTETISKGDYYEYR